MEREFQDLVVKLGQGGERAISSHINYMNVLITVIR